MSRLLKAAGIGGGLALLAEGPALAQAGPGGMSGRMGDADRPGAVALEQLRQQPRYDAGVEYAKAIHALKASRFRQAARFAEHVTQAAPSNPDGWRLLGAAHAANNNWPGSRSAYAMAVKLGPDDANARAGLGLALAILSDARAQEQLDWLRTRARVCADTCPDAAHLQAYAASVEGAIRASPPAGASPG